jgi:RsiW-degrading membrane proteinase PrsW (M82 family)
MIYLVLLICVALAPAVFLLHSFYMRDKYDREPLPLVLKIYFLSFLSVIPAVFLELPVGFLSIGPLSAFLVGLIEESIKFLFIRWLVFRRPEFNEPYDGILFGVVVSLGFASAENVLYVVASGSIAVAIARAVLSVPAHCLWGVIMGFYLGLWKFESDPDVRRGLLFRALAIPVFLHGLFDFLILIASATANLSPIGCGLIIVGQAIVAKRMVSTAQALSPFQRPSPLFSPLAAVGGSNRKGLP